MLGIRDDPDSHIDQEDGTIDRFFLVFSVPPHKFWDSTLK